MVDDFMAIISQVPLQPDKGDLLIWNDPPSYTLSVKSAYNKIVNHSTGGGGDGQCLNPLEIKRFCHRLGFLGLFVPRAYKKKDGGFRDRSTPPLFQIGGDGI